MSKTARRFPFTGAIPFLLAMVSVLTFFQPAVTPAYAACVSQNAENLDSVNSSLLPQTAVTLPADTGEQGVSLTTAALCANTSEQGAALTAAALRADTGGQGVFQTVSGMAAVPASFRKTDDSRGTDTDIILNGHLVKSGSKVRYWSSSGRYITRAWRTIHHKTYYFGKNSYALKGLNKIGSHYYIFSSKGVLKKGWIKYEKHWYSGRKSDGALLTGWQTIHGKKYYISVHTRYRLTGFQTIGQRVYYFNSSGVRQTKNQTVKGKKLVFYKNGTVRSWGNKYYGKTKGEQVVDYACRFIGNPYRWGGASLTNGADCSGVVIAVYAHFGISLPHYDASIRKCGRSVGNLSRALPGDVICYNGHVAIYMGNNRIVHAAGDRYGICIWNNASYRRILSIRRFF